MSRRAPPELPGDAQLVSSPVPTRVRGLAGPALPAATGPRPDRAWRPRARAALRHLPGWQGVSRDKRCPEIKAEPPPHQDAALRKGGRCPQGALRRHPRGGSISASGWRRGPPGCSGAPGASARMGKTGPPLAEERELWKGELPCARRASASAGGARCPEPGPGSRQPPSSVVAARAAFAQGPKTRAARKPPRAGRMSAFSRDGRAPQAAPLPGSALPPPRPPVHDRDTGLPRGQRVQACSWSALKPPGTLGKLKRGWKAAIKPRVIFLWIPGTWELGLTSFQRKGDHIRSRKVGGGGRGGGPLGAVSAGRVGQCARCAQLCLPPQPKRKAMRPALSLWPVIKKVKVTS